MTGRPFTETKAQTDKNGASGVECILSIVIPCYNAGAYLQDTIDMLEKENLENCEIILIDDGSSDHTLSVMKENSERYPNIRTFSRENRGVSVTRNEGLLKARGKYIYFLDSDDEITEGSIALYKHVIAEKKEADILAFGYKVADEDGKETKYVSEALDGKELRNEKCADLLFRGLMPMHIGSVVIRRAFLLQNNLLFPEDYAIGEDFDFLRRIALKAKSAYYDQRIAYIYKLRRDSSTDGGRKRYDYNNFRSLLLSVDSVRLARPVLEEGTINYYMAGRYVVHLLSYLRSDYQSDEVTDFFRRNRACLRKKMNKGRSKVMKTIAVFRLLPISMILRLMK